MVIVRVSGRDRFAAHINTQFMHFPDSLFSDVQQIIYEARQKTYRLINSALVESYWQIGKRIMEEEQKGKNRADYGTYLIIQLATKLMTEFGKGFTERELRRMRQFYMRFPIRGTLRPELSWSHYRLIIRIEDQWARDYYSIEAAEGNWSVRQLERNIQSRYYERLLSTQNKNQPPPSPPGSEKINLADLIKDPYILEFLQIEPPAGFSENRMEAAIIANLKQFLMEMGKGFCFVRRQYRIATETKNFYIDLVFYNYLLKCFVLIDLKTTELTHQDIGQMDMYVRIFEDTVKPDGDNPTIGIILCSEKDKTIVKYSVLEENRHLFACTYSAVLPTEEELKAAVERDRHIMEEKLKEADA